MGFLFSDYRFKQKMEKLFYMFCMTIIVVKSSQVQEEEFIFSGNTQLNHTDEVLSASLIGCSAHCAQSFNNCLAFNFDNDTGRCIWSSDCSAGGVTTSGRTFRRKFLSGIKRDCSDVPVGCGSGMYKITPINNDNKDIDVYCDMDTERGGWTVIQRRVNAATNFYRNWIDYKTGFGNLQENFWLGNDNIHAIVQQKPYKVRFDLEDNNGNTAYAEYSTFIVDSESTDYTLTINGYSGNAGDAMTQGENPFYHNLNGMRFSTYDRDNDNGLYANCALQYTKCGWWINYCTLANINGVYNSTDATEAPDRIYWWNWRGYDKLKRVEMKIKS